MGFFSLELLGREKKSHVHHVVHCRAISRMIFQRVSNTCNKFGVFKDFSSALESVFSI